jgi:FAD/FMN-containing dehydrogenase
MASSSGLRAATLRALRDVVGAAQVRSEPEETAYATVDWTGRFRGSTPAVVRPADVDEVAAVLAVCARDRVAVVPQGGNTGLVGGSVPLQGELVVDLRRLDHIGPIDTVARQVTAGAGVTIAALQHAAHAAGLEYAVDLAARDSATVGGTIATNAGGMHVLRWGTTRRQLLGIEAVRADGAILRRLDGLEKDNTGYDLAQLLCGSEGTLAIITAARLRLIRRPVDAAVALIGLPSVAAAVDAVATLQLHGAELDAAELMLAAGVDLVCERFERPKPFATTPAVVLLVEARARDDAGGALAAAIDGLGGPGSQATVTDSAIATDAAGRTALWAYREDHTTAIATLGPAHKLDVTLPIARLAPFVERVPEIVGAVAADARVWQFGHLGDGNIHVNVTGLAPDDDRVDEAVLEAVAGAGGSISAEHGIGTAKRAWLHLNRSPEEIATFRALKRALDPLDILNPNVLLPPESQAPTH